MAVTVITNNGSTYKIRVDTQAELDSETATQKARTPNPFEETNRDSVNNDGMFPLEVTFKKDKKTKKPKPGGASMSDAEVIQWVKDKWNLP